MAKKFDTNPLDPEFPEKVKERSTQGLESGQAATRAFAGSPVATEEQTRPLGDSLNNFPSDEGVYNPPVPYEETVPNKRHSLGSVSIPENILLALPYIPISFIGLIAGIIELVFIPRTEPRVRFHAAQGVAAHIAIYLITMLLGFLSMFSDAADIASGIFWVVTTIILLVFAFKAYKGKPIHIEAVESLTDWVEEKISLQK